MPIVAGFKVTGHAHFLPPEEGSGLQNTVYLGECAHLVRRMAGRFDSVAPVERVVRDRFHVHEATSQEVNHVVESCLGV